MFLSPSGIYCTENISLTHSLYTNEVKKHANERKKNKNVK